MNKQELIKKYEGFREIWNNPGSIPALECFLRDLAQLDEPEKPVIPQFVAEWIRYCKSNKLTLLGAFDPVSEHGIGLANTFTGEVWKAVDWAKRNQGIFACAWLFGYEVEKEKLYTVEIPNPALDNLEFVIVLKRLRGRVCLVSTYDYMGRELSDEYRLTESEIRKDFEWAWKWAEPVED
ncbi:DUF1642 domain-containing protein [Streptococcus pluranimalium]|uniref:DUF1642 domain-containing protein n=1 Tax=Streptococcus pluranimalium TaxID=82348 RepID=UPI003F66830B